ncbi:hypothetical protein MC885_014809, partial [Smutsia gigantea]
STWKAAVMEGCLIAEMWYSLSGKEKTMTFQLELTKPWRKCSGKNNVFYILDHGLGDMVLERQRSLNLAMSLMLSLYMKLHSLRASKRPKNPGKWIPKKNWSRLPLSKKRELCTSRYVSP